MEKKEKQLIEAAKYGYNYHANTQFPNKPFEENCKNNFLQWLSSKQYHYSNDSVEHECKYCNAMTTQPDELCYMAQQQTESVEELKMKFFKFWKNDFDNISSEDAMFLLWNFFLPHLQKQQESDAVEFAEWMNKNYTFVSRDLGITNGAWVNHNENEIYVNGSDFHKTELINKKGSSIQELYKQFKKNK